jgi:cobalamin synthase
MTLFNKLGKREGLIYIIVLLWIIMGIFAVVKESSLTDLAVYFAVLKAYAATYIWAESKRPSSKTSIMRKGPISRRELMIYIVVLIWAIAGTISIQFNAPLKDLSIYFASLTGFVASWIAGEKIKPEDEVNQNIKR